MLVMIGLTAFDIYDRHHQSEDTSKWTDIDTLERVPSRIFRNETVVLDGKYFLQPTFDHVSFIYNGTAGVAMDNAHFSLSGSSDETAFTVGSQNNAVKTTLQIESLLFAASGCK